MFYSKAFDQTFMFRSLLFDSFVRPAYYGSSFHFISFIFPFPTSPPIPSLISFFPLLPSLISYPPSYFPFPDPHLSSLPLS